jgi:MFS family permease
LFTSAPAHGRRAHYLLAAGLFGLLGFHVGVWAVQLAPLSAGLRLDPAALGAALTAAAAAGLVTLFAGGTLADLVGRRPVLVTGFAGTGAAFVLMALAGRFATLIPAVLLYGLSVSFVDLGANTVGSAYEQAYAVTAMTGLHAWFSGGATAALRRFGERRVVTAAGLLAAVGLLTAVMAPDATGAIGGLLLTGFALAPVVPTGLSLAGRSAPGRSGQAVATATAAGYGSFILSPLTVGLTAPAAGLRLALGLIVLTSLGIAGLAIRWPGSRPG